MSAAQTIWYIIATKDLSSDKIILSFNTNDILQNHVQHSCICDHVFTHSSFMTMKMIWKMILITCSDRLRDVLNSNIFSTVDFDAKCCSQYYFRTFRPERKQITWWESPFPHICNRLSSTFGHFAMTRVFALRLVM